jgi:hypothetical protein
MLAKLLGRKGQLPWSPARFGRALLIAMATFLATAPSEAQESLRLSLAGAQAARARREAAETPGFYNVKLGPTAWNFGAEFGLEANDNIRLESENQMGDLIIHPGLNTRMILPVSQVNSLNLAFGAGYSAYVEHPEFSRFYITPGSEITFDAYVADFWFNFHDRFSMTEDNYQDPTVVGSADYSMLQNVAGLTVTWDLNKVVAQVGYDHVNYGSLYATDQNQAGQPDGMSEVFSVSAGYRITSAITAGLELGGSLLSYSQQNTNQFFSDATEWSAGGFVQAQISQYLSGRANVGYTIYTPEETVNGISGDFSGLYADLELTHRLNKYVDYTLSAGRTINFAFYGGNVDLYFVRWQAHWHFLHKIDLGTAFDYEHGTQLGVGGETFDRYGPVFSVGRAITPKLSASLNYQYFWRSSNVPGRDYAANIVTLNGTYRF